MKKVVYLDMDGTIFDLYGQNDWLDAIKNEDSTIFGGDRRIITEEKLREIFPENEYDVRILTMTPLNASKEYCEKVIEEKNKWLDSFFPSITKRIFKSYGHNKNLKNSASAILIDDSEPIRNSWKGTAINPMELWG